MLKVFTNIRSKLKYFHLFTRDLWNKYTWAIHSLGTLLTIKQIITDRRSRPEVFCKKGVLQHFAKFTVKHKCRNFLLQACNRFFPVNFAKFKKNLFWEHLRVGASIFCYYYLHKFPENLFSKECFENFLKRAHQNKSASSSKCKLWERYSNNLSSSRRRFKLKMHLLLHYSISTRFQVSIVSGS